MQGYLAEAMFPFEYEEDLEAAITGEANKGAIRSFWDDEVNEDGTIERTSGRAVGTEDLTAWGQAVWVAMQTQAKNMDAAEDREREVMVESIGDEVASVAVGSDADGPGSAGQAAVQGSKETVAQHGLAMQALILAKLGERIDFSDMDADTIKQVDAEAAKAISEAAFEEQVCLLWAACAACADHTRMPCQLQLEHIVHRCGATSHSASLAVSCWQHL